MRDSYRHKKFFPSVDCEKMRSRLGYLININFKVIERILEKLCCKIEIK